MIKRIRETIKYNGKNILWSNLGYSVETFASLILSIIFARFVGKNIYGDYLFIISIFSLVSFVAIPGTATVILKCISCGFEGIYKKASFLSFYYSLIGVPIIILAGMYFLKTGKTTVGNSLIYCSFLFPFYTALTAWIPAFKGMSDFKLLTKLLIIFHTSTLIIVGIVLFQSKNLVVISLTYFSIQSILNLIFYFIFYKKPLNNKIEKNWKNQSFALTISNLSGIIFGKADIFFMGLLLTSEKIAIYGLTMKLGSIFFKLIKGSIEALLPKLYKKKEISIADFYKPFFISFLIPLILIPFIKYPINILYGYEFQEVIFLSKIYLTVIPFYFFYNVSLTFLIKYNLNKEINISRISAMVIVLISYLILIPLWSTLGGVVSSMIFFIFQSLYNMYVLSKKAKAQ